MKVVSPIDDWFLYCGDCIEVLHRFKDCCADSLVTDPPAGISFMGKAWDHHKGGRAEWVAWMASVMRECYRVLKPGAHGLIWALPRTSHWMATALEDAGFEIRDVITHLFGTGFPKSLDVSKAIDKAAGAEREIIGPKSTFRKPQSPNGWDCTQRAEHETAPATDDAKRWQGFGTALKPASEHWILIRKPCSEKTVAANVLKWGTGAINVDGCRVGYASGADFEKTARGVQAMRDNKRDQKQSAGWDRPWQEEKPRTDVSNVKSAGRFPANLVLDEEAAAMLDEQSGEAKPKQMRQGRRGGKGFGMFDDAKSAAANGVWPADIGGGASRFFYVAKASKSDRGADNKHPTVKSTKLMAYLCRLVTPPGGTVLDPFMGSGSTGVAALAEGFEFVGIEQELTSFQTAQARVEAV